VTPKKSAASTTIELMSQSSLTAKRLSRDVCKQKSKSDEKFERGTHPAQLNDDHLMQEQYRIADGGPDAASSA